MKPTKNMPFHNLERQLVYVEFYLSIRHEPYQFNTQVSLIDTNVKLILAWVKKNAEVSSTEKLEHAFIMLNRYLVAYQRLYISHPFKPMFVKK
jgi:hypothetical protein